MPILGSVNISPDRRFDLYSYLLYYFLWFEPRNEVNGRRNARDTSSLKFQRLSYEFLGFFSSILIFKYLIFYGPSRSIVRHRARPPISTQLIGAMGDHSLREWSQWKWYIKTPECRSTAFLGRAKREERIMNRTVDDVMGSGVVMSWAWNEK